MIGDGSGDPTFAALSGDVTMDNTGDVTIAGTSVEGSMLANSAKLQTFRFEVGDRSTELTTGDDKLTFTFPSTFTLTDIFMTVETAPTDAILIVDVEDTDASSIFTTNLLTIDSTEVTSKTAATARSLTDTSVTAGADWHVNIDQIGSTFGGAGITIYVIGYET